MGQSSSVSHAFYNSFFFTLLLLLSPFPLGTPCVIGTPILPPIPFAARAAGWEDVGTTYGLVFSLQSPTTCALTVSMSVPVPDARNIGILPLSSISADGAACDGLSPMALVPEQVARNDALLTEVGLGGLAAALTRNANAAAVATHSNNSQMLVGWHAGDSICGVRTADTNTIYFFIREPDGYNIAFLKDGLTNVVDIPPDQTALLIIPLDGARTCLYADVLRPAAQPVTLTVAGQVSALQPQGVPSTASPSASASLGAIVVTDAGAGSGSSSSSETISMIPSPLPLPPSSDAVPPSASPVFSVLPSVSISAPAVPVPVPVDDDEPPAPSLPPDSATSPSESSSSSGGGAACFPASARLPDGTSFRDLPVGADLGRPFGRVLFFTHRAPFVRSQQFVRLSLSGHVDLVLSPGHYVPLASGRILPAFDIRPHVHALTCAKSGMPLIVRSVTPVCAVGAFNAQSQSGLLPVQGVVVSAYTTAIQPERAHAFVQYFAKWTAALPAVRAVAGVVVSAACKYGAPGQVRRIVNGALAILVH